MCAMAGYQLEATESGETYSIPQGETMIGRGPFLGISDKKVSRNHAILEVVDDKFRIKPIHVNPCFYRASYKGTFVPLEKDKWCWLHDGDWISLLPDKFSFRVIAQHSSQNATLRNSQALDEDCALNNGSTHITAHYELKAEVEEPSCLATDNVKPVLSQPSAKCDEKKVENNSYLSSAVSCKVDGEQSKPPQRKRTLPKWMLQGDLMVQSLPSTVIKAAKKRRNVTNYRTEKTVENVTKNKQPCTVKSKDNGEEGPTKKSKAAATEDLPGPSSDTLQARAEHKSSFEPVIDSGEEEMEVECYDHSPCPSPKESSSSPSGSTCTKQHQSSDSQAANNVLSQSATSSQTAHQASKRRTPCMYAERCYRKNPVHFQEFSHPGDSDYHDVESEDENDDRPECPYGTDCYRKNPQHKLEYKHTRPPGRRLRKRTTKKAKRALDDDSDNDGEPNEYDLEDSFIDDDDEEEEDITDEDSDWMPDSEEKDSEDVKRLLKEAKRFVKGKH